MAPPSPKASLYFAVLQFELARLSIRGGQIRDGAGALRAGRTGPIRTVY
jgi:hypothetical protein